MLRRRDWLALDCGLAMGTGLPEAEQDVAKAAHYFEKCLSLQPDNKGLKFNLGVSLVRTGVKENIARGKVLMTEGQ